MVLEIHFNTAIMHAPQCFGHQLKTEFTRFPDAKILEHSSEYHCVVAYDISGVRCLVRFEADCYHDTGMKDDESSRIFGSLGIKSNAQSYRCLRIIKSGLLISSPVIAEMKTMRHNRKEMCQEWMPRLYISDSESLMSGSHEKDVFEQDRIQEIWIQSELVKWERGQEPKFKIIIQIINKIRKLVKDILDGKPYLSYNGGNSGIIVQECQELGLGIDEKVVTTLWGRASASH